MKRTDFVKRISLLGIGSLLLPSFLKANGLVNSNFNGKVVIVGAGAAGLYAGYMLKELGVNFEIIEASNRIGGRLKKLDGFADVPIDLGAAWLHGKKSKLAKLLQEKGVQLYKDKSDAKYWLKNKLTEELPEKYEILVDEDELLGYGKKSETLSDLARRKGLKDGADLAEYMAGEYGASARLLSLKGIELEGELWNSGNSDFKFEKTYFDCINDIITKEVIDRVRLNTVVNKIDYTRDKVVIKGTNDFSIDADKVIVTIPLTMLQADKIAFNPPLPAKKREAIHKIGMEPGMKIYLKFSKAFYCQNTIGGKICAAYVDDSYGKKTKDNLLMAFLMGDKARFLSEMEDDKAVKELINELDVIYGGRASKYFMEAYVQDWSKEPFIAGAYSYPKINMGDARKVLAKPINNMLFFAGEASHYNGHAQTVHGATETGYREVMNIMNA